MKISFRYVLYILLFLFSINLYNLESRIIVFLFLTILLEILNSGRKLYIPATTTSIVLFLFCCIFYLFAAIYNPAMWTFYILPFFLGPVLGYTTGLLILETSNYEKSLKDIVMVIVFGRFCHGLLNMIISGGYVGFNRNGLDFWTKDIIAATGQGALMTMSISMLFYSLFIVPNSKFLKKISIITMVILSIINSVLSASRTAILIMIIVFVICLLIFSGKSIENNKENQNIIIKSGLILLVLILMFKNNLFGITSYWEATPLFDRLTTESSYQLGDENRQYMLNNAVASSLFNPFGDGDMSSTAHNLWLDVLKQTGWGTFGLLVYFTHRVLKNLYLLIKDKSSSIDIKSILLSVIIGSLINFSVEPIFKGMPYYFVAFCIIAGVLEKYIILKREKRKIFN